MTLAQRVSLASRTINRPFSRAFHAVAYICLIAAFVLTLGYQTAAPGAVLWPAMLAILPMIVLLFASGRAPSGALAVGYLVIATLCLFCFALTFYRQQTPITPSDAFSFALLEVPLIMVAGPATGFLARFAWCGGGYLAAMIAVGAAQVVAGVPVQFDATTFLAFIAACAIVSMWSIGRRTARRSQPMLHRAARDEQLAALRYRMEVKAASLMHDTVLSDLAAIAGSVGSQLSGSLREQVQGDLLILTGEDWLSDVAAVIEQTPDTDWQNSGLYLAIEEARALGLEVDSTGDLVVILRLSDERSNSLGLAVKQCLINVLKHSGTTKAEVAVFGSEREVSVMVIDAGRGFSEAETGADRLGLRQSVRSRMEVVGGSVQVWSTPGRGTSIMIRVPIDSPAVGAERHRE